MDKVESDKQKNSARKKAYRARKTGVLVPGLCEVCGDTNVVGHHEDYGKPLDVRWLCRRHHAIEHQGSESLLRYTTVWPGFPGRLRRLRKKHGYSQAALAQIVGVHTRTIGFWETGKHHPNPGDALIKTAVVLNTSVKYLLTGRNK